MQKPEDGIESWTGFGNRLEDLALGETPDQSPVVNKSPQRNAHSKPEKEYRSHDDNYYGEGYGSDSSDDYGSPSKRVLLGTASE